jgi:methylenetetrahydrofolate reductase (NADPH)
MTTSTLNKNALTSLLQKPKYEILPMKNVEQQFAFIPSEAKVTVTVSPSKGNSATLELSEQLSKTISPERITPHISARLVESKEHLNSILKHTRDLGIKELFIVGGDTQTPAGPFANSFELVRAIRDIDADIRLGITAYPDGHPSIPNEMLLEDLQRKAPYAQFMSSQLCFDGEKISRWLEQTRNLGINLPLLVGVAGVVDIIKLTQIATRIGVGDSVRYLSKHAGTVFRLLGGYKPDELLEQLTPTLADETNNVAGFHIYTFNQLEKTERWRKDILQKLGSQSL